MSIYSFTLFIEIFKYIYARHTYIYIIAHIYIYIHV